jgi:hypothetical protein
MRHTPPKVGDTLWSPDRHNGIIDGIDRFHGVVFVNHYDKGRGEYDLDDLTGNWDDRLNQWVLPVL